MKNNLRTPAWFSSWRDNEFYHLKVKVGITYYITLAILSSLIAIIVTRAIGWW